MNNMKKDNIDQNSMKEDPIVTKKIEDGKYIVETSISVNSRIEEIMQKFIILDEEESIVNEKLSSIISTRDILSTELNELNEQK